jgi:inner membrane protein
MDNVTHTLTGLMLSRAGLNRWHPRAALLLMLSANVPDVDVVSALGGSVTYLEWHRGITHSILMIPVMALLPVLFICALGRSTRQWRAAQALAMLGVASHLAIDWTNSYAVRLLLPFSRNWFHGDLNFVFDVWIWAVLFIAVAAPWVSGLVSAEIGGRRGSGQAMAIFALSFFLIYDFSRYLLHERAVAVLDSRLYDGSIPARVAAFPGPVNPMRWTGWVEGVQSSARYELDLANNFDPDSGTKYFRPEPSPAQAAALRTRPFQVLANFSLYPLWNFTPSAEAEGGMRVELRDERFLNFVATAIVDRSNRVQRAWFHF